MRLPSLYGFYKYYFNYPLKGKKNYALAIREAEKQISDAFDLRDESYIIDYEHQSYPRQLTISFLKKLYQLMNDYYEQPIFELDYHKNSIHLPKELLTSRIQLDIDFGYFYDRNAKKIILLEYGKLNEVSRWIPVFKTLVTSFELTATLPPNLETIVFWDLSKGLIHEEDYTSATTAPMEQILKIARKIVNERRRG
ncbi:hypothetical protein HNQ34_003008 [Anoxybacillus tepidamans]|uniref:Uncharacterized protein n=1 Tax=Anoxybacteroides tepidamans TaxID=265948 RepID=A0A7W8MVS2_9BACL|nr:hypothetical protein [Anoxybacillus tepidamans]MBB5325902.1 hypothetical protein [Anoxybacillus tepidamans]